MVNRLVRTSLVGAWINAVAGTLAASIAMGANVSTTALLVALVVAPGVVMVVIGAGAPPPTVAEILYAVETKGRRR